YLLHLRTTTSLFTEKNDKIADMVWANRTRQEVLELCERDTLKIKDMADRAGKASGTISNAQEDIIKEQKFWIAVNKAEAYFGLGDMQEYEKAAAEAKMVQHEDWMMESFTTQLQKLSAIMNKQVAIA
ncbi:MAG TPA: hypothetical protein VFV68_16105, partial [Agriterribacter sp.]|nr:hypothetical protein [Agriterribacter sp.]